MKSNTRKQTGFSLIELMVALVISLLLLAGILQIFSGTKKTYTMEEELSRLQENARFAMDKLTSDIRISSYQGCADPATTQPTIRATSVVGTEMVQGTDGTGLYGSDELTLQFANGGGIPLLNDMASITSDVVVSLALAGGIDVDSLVTIADCENIDVFRVTSRTEDASATPVPTVTFGHGTTGAKNNSAELKAEYTTAARLMTFSTVVYNIQAASSPTNQRGKPVFSLYRGNDELVEGVENMQILYGERLGANSTSNIRYVTATDVSNWDNVVSMRVGLLLATREAVRETDDTTTYSVLGVAIAPGTALTAATYDKTDRRVRRVFTTTAAIRNRR